MKPNIDWVIHGCGNGVVCEIDGKTENGFMPGTCNFHETKKRCFGQNSNCNILMYSIGYSAFAFGSD